jgi:hypothetical protein
MEMSTTLHFELASIPNRHNYRRTNEHSENDGNWDLAMRALSFTAAFQVRSLGVLVLGVPCIRRIMSQRLF